MSSTIYYFSATGNSLAVAKKLGQQLEDCELVPIASLLNENAIIPKNEIVGLVFPLYFLGIPMLVKSFIDKIVFDEIRYIFTVVTKGNELSGGAIPLLSKILKRKGHRLNAGFYITMPGNYLPLYNVPNEAEREKQFQACEAKVSQIAKAIIAENSIKETALLSILRPMVHNLWATNVKNSDRRFSVDASCISCGVCEQVCPVNNIKMGQSKPEWLHHCEECLACLHHCPKQAIQCGIKTKNKLRYRHPEILVAEITAEKVKAQ